MNTTLETSTNTYIPVDREQTPDPVQAEHDFIAWVLDAYLNGAITELDAARILLTCKL